MDSSAFLKPAEQTGGVDLGGFLVHELVPAAATGSRVTVVDHVVPPRSLAAPVHVHDETVEISIVTEGRIGVQIGDEEFEAGVGDVVHKPAGIPHAFWNPADEPARLVELLTPSGFEHYFTELAAAFGPKGPDLERVAAIAAAHDIELDPRSIEPLLARRGLRL